LAQLTIDASIVSNTLLVVIGAIALGLAIGLGLGTKDLIKNLTAGIYMSKSLKQETNVKVRNIEGKIIQIGTVTTTLEDLQNKQFEVANSSLLESL
jgi:small-conductance mechanosensitive channel